MRSSTKPITAFYRIIHSIFHLSKLISPYAIGIVVFVIIYLRMCTNESDIIGNRYFEQGDYQRALNHYNEYLELYPHDIKTRYNRGRCFDELGQNEKAEHDYLQVLDRDPNNVKALLSLSQNYYNEGNYEYTINLCTSATLIDKQNHLAHYFKARALHKIGDVFEALKSYNAAISINPDFGFAYLQRGSLMLSLGWRPFGCYDLQTADSLHVEGASEALMKYCR